MAGAFAMGRSPPELPVPAIPPPTASGHPPHPTIPHQKQGGGVLPSQRFVEIRGPREDFVDRIRDPLPQLLYHLGGPEPHISTRGVACSDRRSDTLAAGENPPGRLMEPRSSVVGGVAGLGSESFPAAF